jgi:NH3-dependent NAD+ synthetase
MPTSDARLAGLIDWVRRTSGSNDGRGALVPVSGGSDSALCFWLCVQALPPGRAIGVYAGQELRCAAWFRSLGPVHLVDSPAGDDVELRRWILMLSLAKRERSWLVGSRNRTEEVLGTYSLASRLATYLPLAGLWKSEVMELAALVGVPAEVLRSSQRADPECGRPKEMADIPFQAVDRFLQVKIKSGDGPVGDLDGLTKVQVAFLERIYHRNRFKSALPLRGPLCPGGQ